MKIVNCDKGMHDFEASTIFHTFSDDGVIDGYGVEVKAWCKCCGGIFEFGGLKPLVHREKPGVDEMGIMAYLPIKYSGKHEYGRAYQ